MGEDSRGFSEEEQELLRYLLEEDGGEPARFEEILSRGDRKNLPLSFAQQRLWFLNRLEPNSASYNTSFAIRIFGRLDVAALGKSMDEIERRHEALRTSFTSEGGVAAQIVNPSRGIPLQLIDLQYLPAQERENAAAARATKESMRSFDLELGPVVRGTLVRLDEADHVLIVVIHHIVSDGWSMALFYGELSALYQAFAAGDPSPLRELPIQYADFALWQREMISGETLECHLSYWRKQLQEAPVLQLPTDHSRPKTQELKGSMKTVAFPRKLSAKLKTLSQSEGVTFFMTLLAAFQVLLSRYSSQEDIVVGTPIANRNRVEIEGLIGFFVNMLVLRTDLSGDPSFRELLGRVREVCLGAYSHQDLPFEKLVEELRPERDTSRNPLFQVLFALQNAPRPPLELKNLTLSRFEFARPTVRFDLEFHLWEDDEGLSGFVAYATDLFDVRTVERMLQHYQILMEGIVADPCQPISKLPLLSESERNDILIRWNDTAVEYPGSDCIHGMFVEQLDRTPDAIAVIHEDQQLSYKELDAKANSVARHLMSLGVGEESLVALCVDRSPAMIVGLLGILKAGGAYVPLDPEYPMDRLTHMLRSAKVKTLLTQKKYDSLFSGKLKDIVFIDTDWSSQLSKVTGTQSAFNSPASPAYVIFTSGSTGKPKGIVMEHRSLANLVNWQIREKGFSLGMKTLQFASLSFDVSFQEIFSTLCSGGSLVLISEEMRRNPVALIQFIAEHRVERLFLPFIYLQEIALAAAHNDSAPASLKEVYTAGERLQVTREIRELFRKLKNCSLYNQYGPSESHVVTSYRLPDAVNFWASLPSIGQPIANTQCYVLDTSLQPVPIGTSGELHIGGFGLARGYIGEPDLTKEKFIRDPFSEETGSRLYKTGDLVRWLPDGSIDFLGRIDQQVKIRGFRVEPAEIEAALGRFPGVEETVVIAREDVPGNRHLVAYVVFTRKPYPEKSRLRSSLKQELPDYMVPSKFVFIDALPLLPNGKLDRRSLPAPENNQPASSAMPASPRNDLERRLVQAWEKVLDTSPVGIRDNFFDLGGHSLLATRLVWEIEKAIGVNLPLQTFFRLTTVEMMAASITGECVSTSCEETGRREAREGGLSPEEHKKMLTVVASGIQRPEKPGSLMTVMHPDGSKPPLFWCFNVPSSEPSALSDHLGMEQPLYVMFSGSGVIKWWEGTSAILATHYIDEILSIQPNGPYRIGGNCGGARVACEIALRLLAQGRKVDRLCLMEFFDSRLFEYRHPLLLLYGRESYLKAYEPFHWLKPGWSRAFNVVPEVDWIPGAHGEFFLERNIPILAEKVSNFLEGNAL